MKLELPGRVALSVLSLCAVMTPAWPAEPTSPATRAEMIRLIDGLEKHPADPEAGATRGKVMAWLTDAPDVSVTVCGALLGGLDKYKEDEAGDLLMQLMFSEAKFILEHPEQSSDDHAVHLAGLEGVLRTYSAMQAGDPKLKIPPVDNLARLQAEKKLPDHVAKAMAKCN